MTYGLNDTFLNAIRQVLIANERIARAVLFGSRAKGTYRPGSDIDLVLYGDALSYHDLLNVASALDDACFPYRVDVLLHRQITEPALLDHIDRVGKTLYLRENVAA